MQKIKINYIIDFLMAISFLVSSITGLIMFFFLPGGNKGGRYQEFLGITKHLYSNIHNWSGIVLIALIIIHVILHWTWIVQMTKRMFSQKKN